MFPRKHLLSKLFKWAQVTWPKKLRPFVVSPSIVSLLISLGLYLVDFVWNKILKLWETWFTNCVNHTVNYTWSQRALKIRTSQWNCEVLSLATSHFQTFHFPFSNFLFFNFELLDHLEMVTLNVHTVELFTKKNLNEKKNPSHSKILTTQNGERANSFMKSLIWTKCLDKKSFVLIGFRMPVRAFLVSLGHNYELRCQRSSHSELLTSHSRNFLMKKLSNRNISQNPSSSLCLKN